jgi:hypothetical protein
MTKNFVFIIALLSCIFLFSSCEKEEITRSEFHYSNTEVLNEIRELRGDVRDWREEDTRRFNQLAQGQDSMLQLQNLTYEQVLDANTNIEVLTNIALEIQDSVNTSLPLIRTVKDLNIGLRDRFEGFGLQLGDIDLRLSNLWFAFNAFGNEVFADLLDIQTILGGVDNVVNTLLNQSNLGLEYILQLLGYAQSADAQLGQIHAAVVVNTGLNLDIYQQNANGFANASAFYTTTNATLNQHGLYLQDLVFDVNALQAAFNQHAAAAAAAWSQATFERTQINGNVQQAITAIAGVQTDVSYIRAKTDLLCSLAPGFANQLNEILLVSNNVWNTVQTVPDAISALEQSLLTAISAGFTGVDLSFAEVRNTLETRFGDISATLATLATGDEITGLRAQITNGFAQNQEFTANLIRSAQDAIINAVQSGNQSVLNAVGNFNTAMTNMLRNIVNLIDDLDHAIDNIDGFNNCCNACGQSAPIIINNTVITNVNVRNACCTFPGNPMPPMNGCND